MSSPAIDREHFKAKQNNQILEARRSVISELNTADTDSNIASDTLWGTRQFFSFDK